MNRLYSSDNIVMRWGNKMADMLLLNIFVILSCLPVFTIGASLVAMHSVLLKIYKDEQTGIWKMYWKAWKQNFKQATIIWILYFIVGIVLFLDCYYIKQEFLAIPEFVKITVYIVVALLCLSFTWNFILISRYENTIRQTIKNSVFMVILHPIYSLSLILVGFLPIIILLLFPRSIPIVILLGFTFSGMIQTRVGVRIFKKIEKHEE